MWRQLSCGIGTDYVADDVMGVFFGLRSRRQAVVEIGGKEKEKNWTKYTTLKNTRFNIHPYSSVLTHTHPLLASTQIDGDPTNKPER